MFVDVCLSKVDESKMTEFFSRIGWISQERDNLDIELCGRVYVQLVSEIQAAIKREVDLSPQWAAWAEHFVGTISATMGYWTNDLIRGGWMLQGIESEDKEVMDGVWRCHRIHDAIDNMAALCLNIQRYREGVRWVGDEEQEWHVGDSIKDSISRIAANLVAARGE